jgi:autotransporter-associated beta strand protein
VTNTGKPIILLDGSTFACTSGANSVNDPIVLSTNAAGGPGNITYTGSGTMTWSNVVSGPGNLIKNNAATATLTLTANNTYTGTTTIGAGTLALSGSGSVASSPVITIASNATFNVSGVSGFTLGAGQTLGNSSSTAKINGSVSTGSGTLALTYVSGTPSVQVTNGTLTLSSTTTVTVNNTGAQLTPGTYALITSATGASVSGTVPSSVTVTGNGAAGTATLAISGGTLNLVVATAPPPQLHFTSISIKGNTLTFSATNGQDGGPFTLFESTNLLLPISQWTPVFTNSFNSSGAINLSTNVVNPGTPNEFFLIEEP